MKTIVVEGTEMSEVAEIIRYVVREEIERFRQAPAIDEAKPLTLDDAINFTGFARQTIYRLTSEGKIPFHKKNGKLFFFRGELIEWIRNEKE